MTTVHGHYDPEQSGTDPIANGWLYLMDDGAGEVPDEAYDFWVDTLEKVYESEACRRSRISVNACR